MAVTLPITTLIAGKKSNAVVAGSGSVAVNMEL